MRTARFYWQPTPVYVRYMREARRRAALRRWAARFDVARAWVGRHAILIGMAALVVGFACAVPIATRTAIAGDIERLAQAQADAAAYRALALRLARGPERGRLLVRLDADGPDDMLAQLEAFARALRAERGEVRP